MKKIISLFLAIILFVFSIPIYSYADAVADGPKATIKYTIGNDETEKTAELNLIGTYKNTMEGRAYLVSLPYGAELTSLKWENSDGIALKTGATGQVRFDKDGRTSYGASSDGFNVKDENKYLIDEEFINYKEPNFSNQFLADESYNTYLKLNDGVEFPTQWVKGFITVAWYNKTSEPSSNNYRDIIYIQISTYNNVEADKTALKAQIDIVTGENESNWHKSGDRFNGKVSEYKTSGSLWSDMLTVLANAITVYDKDTASQDAINTAAINLEKAISKLIPAANVNATELYEEIDIVPKKPLLYTDYTQKSWQEYNAAKASAQALLDSLYDEDRNPTDKNKSSDTILLAAINDKISNLKSVRESMDPLLDFDDSGDVKVKYDALRNLLRVYSPSVTDQSLYTSESYENYLSEYNTAQEYIDSTPSPSGEAGKNQYVKVSGIYKQLWRAIHGLKDKNESITVTIKVVDSLALRLGKTLNEASGVYKLELKGAERNLNAAIDKLNNDRLSEGYPAQVPSNYLYATSINGVLTTKGLDSWDGNLHRGIKPLDFKSPKVTDPSKESTYLDVQLHDGDIITLAFLDQPTVPSSSGTGQDGVDENKFQEYYRQSSLLVDGIVPNETIEVLEGEELGLSAIYAMPHISTYSEGRTYPLSGVTLFVSAPATDIDSITPAETNTGMVSDDEGNIAYGFYEPGYYALSIHALGKNELNKKVVPGVTIGDKGSSGYS